MMVRSMVTVSSIGLTDLPTREISLITTFTDTVFTPGQMVENTQVSGTSTKCTELACLPGPTVVNMKVNTSMTRKKDTEFSFGPMVVSTTASGRMENNTEEAPTSLAKVKPKPVNGKKGNAFSGLKILPDTTKWPMTKETIENERTRQNAQL
jgi:hypothetical protein